MSDAAAAAVKTNSFSGLIADQRNKSPEVTAIKLAQLPPAMVHTRWIIVL